MRIVANLELQFTEAGDLPARVRAAAAAGFDAVEFWRWEHLDLEELAQTARAAGVEIVSIVTDWSVPVAVPDERPRFLAAVRAALAAASVLGVRRLVVPVGEQPADATPAEALATVADALADAAPLAAEAGVVLLLEPLNTLVDHPGAVVSSAADAREVLRRVDHPAVRLLFDVYHSAVQGEDVVAELAASADLIAHVQVADAPGRHEPGTGDIDWSAVVGALAGIGYAGPVGWEFVPTGAAAVDHARAVWDAAERSLR